MYGYRVPLLVISAYATPGYISGKNIYPPSCPNYYCHDFGSILNFIEYVFGLTQGGIGDPHYPYADYYVMDTQQQPPNNFSLYDFFGSPPFSQPPNQFQKIGPLRYGPDCFHHPTLNNCFQYFPVDPDSDENESPSN